MFRMLAAALAALLPLAPPAVAQPLSAPTATLAAMEKLADWQLAHRDDLSYMPAARADARNPRDWQQAAFWIGLTALADRSTSPRFRDAILALGREQGWRLGDRPYHADDHAIGAVWLWAARNGAGPEAIAPLRSAFDRVLAVPKTGSLRVAASGDFDCADRWCWCDALFMAPPVWWGLAQATGDARYAGFADSEYRATAALLLDPAEKLFYRDSRFFDRKGAHGEKLFWSRGNGWVFSGLARLIPLIDAGDPRRGWYETLFRQMAERLVRLQRPNGYWPPSLLGDPGAAADETSGTGFYVHGLAWGIKAGLLPRDRYLPAVAKGWEALVRAIQPDGRLGWVQQVSDRPDAVAAQDTQFYGTGAFLLAGAAVHDLAAATGGASPAKPYALATLNVRQDGFRGADGVYRYGKFALVDHFDPPPAHGPRDALIAFEGPGWETDKIAYRLYLDERNVPDIYGKKLPAPVLPRIGQGKDDYHAMADWGMDILQVDNSLGAGGIGVVRDGKIAQLGPSRISASVANGPEGATVHVENRGFAGDWGEANLNATYAIAPGSRVTRVHATVTGAAPPMVAGIIRHKGTELLEGKSGRWAYIGTWGDQSLARDGLGLALFYRADRVGAVLKRDDGIGIAFCERRFFDYAFAAAWREEPGAPKSAAAFADWMQQTAAGLDAQDAAPAEQGCVMAFGIR